MTQQNRNRLLLVLILALPTAIFIGSIFYNGFSVPPLPPMPNPNGYDDLMKATTMLAPDVGNYTNWDLNELQTIVSEDSNALQLARAGLQKQCRVPLDYNPNATASSTRAASIKRLAAGFAAEGDLAEMQGHPDAAAKSYLDMIHLANESARGGVLIDMLVGAAIESRGRDKLQEVILQLGANACRETATALETLDAQRQTLDDVMRQEDYWSHKAFPGIGHEIVRIIQYRELKKVNQAAERIFENQETKTRKLIIGLATRAYELDKGHPPAKVTDLVTNYLQTIPIDPATGTNMTYLPK